MGEFSCYGCQRPEKGPECHARCQIYAQEKAAHEERRLAAQKKMAVTYGIREQRGRAVTRAERRKRGWLSL